jgi:SAM-dependent methyltransferase
MDPDTYARWRASRLGQVVEAMELELVLAQAGPLAGKRVLDLGSGDGTYALAAARAGAASVVAVDRSARMIAAGRARAEQADLALRWVVADVPPLPLARDSIDVALAVTVLCVARRPDALLAELARVVVPGGVIVLGELGARSVWALQRRARGWLGASPWQHARFWTPARLRAAVVGAGLVPEELVGGVRMPPSERLAAAMPAVERLSARLGTCGAAFLVLRARKPA